MLKGQPESLKTTWLSLWAPEGCLIASKSKDMASAVYVLGSTVHCAAGLGIEAKRVGEFIVVSLAFGRDLGSTAQLVIVTGGNLDEWVCTELEPASPAYSRQRLSSRDASLTIKLLAKSKSSETLLQHAASTGFKSLSVALMRKLYKHLAIPHKGAMPSTEATLVYALVQFVFPEKTEEEVKQLVSMRFLSRSPPVEATITTADVDQVAEDFGPEEEATVRSDLKAVKGPKAMAASGGGVSARFPGGRKGVPAKPVQKDMVVDGSLTSEAARAYLPKVAGCRMFKDVKLHMRWSVTYPKDAPPRSCSKAFGTCSDRGAMFFCLRWVWAEHQLATGEEWPYALE